MQVWNSDWITQNLKAYARHSNTPCVNTQKAHPVYPGEEPAFIFRGECGKFPATTPSIARVSGLSRADVLTLAEISDWVASRLHEEREDLTWPQVCAHLQHYGMPSRIVDFTGDLGRAFDFAGNGGSDVGRLAALPYVPSETGPILHYALRRRVQETVAAPY
jgi:FRG domain-containing protein